MASTARRRVRALVLLLAAGWPAGSRADVWARQGKDGIISFTNVPPVSREWKVLYRTGPGKASSTRGATDPRPPRDRSAERFTRFDSHISDQAAYYHIPERLIRAIIKTESDFDPSVVSSAGARGLMQLMPETARAMGVEDVFNPRQNIFGGARYLQTLVQRFCRTPGDTAGARTTCSEKETLKVIAAYHAGPGAVEKYGGMPPYQTTKDYVKAVVGRWSQYRQALRGRGEAARRSDGGMVAER